MRPGKHTYFSVELPDAEAAVTLAKQIAERTLGSVIVADDEHYAEDHSCGLLRTGRLWGRDFECLKCGHTESKMIGSDPMRSNASGWLEGEPVPVPATQLKMGG
jgi:hypothetical protein